MLGVIERSLPLERVTETESALQVPGYRRQLREFVILPRFITPFASTFLALSIFIFVHVLFQFTAAFVLRKSRASTISISLDFLTFILVFIFFTYILVALTEKSRLMASMIPVVLLI